MFDELFKIPSNKQASEYSPLTLAYIGDTVFELCVRSMIIKESCGSVDYMHKKALDYVKASTQAEMYHGISGFLTEEEYLVLKRGRNAKSNSRTRNATVLEYRYATGIEALFGYLYIKGESNRIAELFGICISVLPS